MAYSNNAQDIITEIISTLEAGIADVHFENVDRFPIPGDGKAYLANYGKAVLIRLDSSPEIARTSDTVERAYNFMLRGVVKDVDNDQQDVTDVAEKVMYYLNASSFNDPYWYGLQVSVAGYLEADPEITVSEKEVDINLEVYRCVST